MSEKLSSESIRNLVTQAVSDWSSTDHVGGREAIRTRYLGRKGLLADFMSELPNVSPEERSRYGKELNEAKKELEALLIIQAESAAQVVDMTLPPADIPYGSLHPITAIMEEMCAIFRELSFEVVDGPEIVTEEENFESLNLDKDHPARDGQDSFFIEGEYLLRTQTTAIQVGEMAKRFKRGDLPIRIVMPGKTYRRESDQTHSPMFHQIDAVMVDTQTTFADLRGILDYFVTRLFGDGVETRFRPHHFPFTEPSAELDIRFKGEHTLDGKQTGWLEMGGCGMIHPEVLKRAGINPKIYQGWAFGMSLERPLMVRHQIPDLRMLFTNDIRFLDQFPKL